MTLMLRILPRWLFRRIKPARQAPTLRRGLAPVCAITVASAVASCGDDSTTPSPTTDMTIVTTDTTTVPTTTDSTVDTTGTPTTGTTSSVDTTGAGMTTGTTSSVDTTGTGTTTDTTVDTGTPTTNATTSDTAGTSTTADTTMVDTTTDTTSDTTTTDPTDPPILTFGEIEAQILIPSCANVICHTGAPYFEPMLVNGVDSDVYETLMTWTVEECNNQPLVVPRDPDNSALLMLVRRECEPIVVESTGEVFESMPPFCTEPLCLHQDDYDALAAWINAGAPE